MNKYTGLTIGISLMLAGCAGSGMDKPEMAAKNMSHAHMGHVTTAWKGTPEGQGLLPTAMAEAEIAATHAHLAAKKLDDLGWMKMHTKHVINALDPAREAKGPGLGYGVVAAASGTAKHINLAANSEGASANVKAHAEHVATSAENTVGRANEILALADKVLAADSANAAASGVEEMAALADQLNNGFDANKDGKVTWQKDEGGLNASNKHMNLMAQGENKG